MVAERVKILRGALARQAIDVADKELAEVLGVNPPSTHPTRVADKEWLAVLNLEYRLQWLKDVKEVIIERNKADKKLKSENKKLKTANKNLKTPTTKSQSAKVKKEDEQTNRKRKSNTDAGRDQSGDVEREVD